MAATFSMLSFDPRRPIFASLRDELGPLMPRLDGVCTCYSPNTRTSPFTCSGAESVSPVATTSAPNEARRAQLRLRRPYGWESAVDAPSAELMWRVFEVLNQEQQPGRAHQQTVTTHVGANRLRNVNRDATTVEGPDRPTPNPVAAAIAPMKRCRRKQGEERPYSRQQYRLAENPADLAKECGVGFFLPWSESVRGAGQGVQNCSGFNQTAKPLRAFVELARGWERGRRFDSPHGRTGDARLADGALAAGGEVTGVIPRAMMAEERAHRGLTRLIAVDTMHERKSQMEQLADAFIALPGGIGTLEEVVEVFTWLQLGLLVKPVGLLNAAGFYDALLQFLAHMRADRFLTSEHYSMPTVGIEVESMLDEILATRHVRLPKPIERVPPEPLNADAKLAVRGGH